MNNRIVIAGTKSGVGKTTISIGIMAALTKRGMDVQPFKVGPDYIDPGFHTVVTSNASRNLDSYFLGQQGLQDVFLNAAKNKDISVIEGVMGLFDGKRGINSESSTADVAKILKAPVILVMDVQKMAQSAAAMVYGYQQYDPELQVAGVILNNIGSSNHYDMIKEVIEEKLELTVLGYLPKQSSLTLPERHLGLVPTAESETLEQFIDELSTLVEEYIDLEQLIALSQTKTMIKQPQQSLFNITNTYQEITLGVAYDEGFNFYYSDNLTMLENKGITLKYFSPIHDEQLPVVDGLYIGGGFPESFLEALEKNKTMRESIKNKIDNGLPTYAECGGLMYLTEAIISKDEQYQMVGVIPATTEMTDRLQAMGYSEAQVIEDNLLLKKGQTIRGHEFHYSRLVAIDETINFSYQLNKTRQGTPKIDGIVYKNLLATYLHVHFGHKPEVMDNFLTQCQHYKKDQS